MGDKGGGGSEDAWRCWWLPELVQTLYSGGWVWREFTLYSGGWVWSSHYTTCSHRLLTILLVSARHVSSLPSPAPLLSQTLYQFISTNPSSPPPPNPPFRL